MTNRATGTFDVKLNPRPLEDYPEGSPLGRMSLEKQFNGDLEGTSMGQMLTAGTAVEGSGCYVAVELVTGKLDGRSGSFEFYHTGIMRRGTPELTILVVPDSGTNELTGISGKMMINIADGQHSYDFEYTIGD